MTDHDAALKLLREIRDGKHSLPGTLVQIDRLFAKADDTHYWREDQLEPRTPENERAMRFGYLLSEIELSCKAILAGREHDIPMGMMQMRLNVDEAHKIALEVSREALDKVTDVTRGDV